MPGQLAGGQQAEHLVVRLEEFTSFVQQLVGPGGNVVPDAGVQHEVVVASGDREGIELHRTQTREDGTDAVEPGGLCPRRGEQVALHEEAAGGCGRDRHGLHGEPRIRGLDSGGRALGRSFPILRFRMATTRDYYEILGLERGASDDEIKRSFRKLAQQWHPDVNVDPDADARFKEINEAYQVLSDPGRRQQYDVFGRAGVGGTGAEGYGPFGGFQGFGDIFDAFFGGAAAGGGTRRTRRPAGADLRYDLQLTFDEAISGTEKELSFTSLDTCETCAGSGAEEGSEPVTCPRCDGSGECREVRGRAGRDGQPHALRTLPRSRPGRGQALPQLPR